MGGLASNHSSLAARILALGCDLYDRGEANRKKVQAGVFLAKVRRSMETGSFELQSQSGYHFKWTRGVYSPSLDQSWKHLIDGLSFFSLGEIIAPYKKKHCVRVCRPIHMGPDRTVSETGVWAETLAAVAYLQFAGSWEKDKAKEEIRESIGTESSSYYDEAEFVVKNILYE